jgi:hypothetical protein
LTCEGWYLYAEGETEEEEEEEWEEVQEEEEEEDGLVGDEVRQWGVAIVLCFYCMGGEVPAVTLS